MEESLKSLHSHHSQLRERIVEFVFMGQLMQRLWRSQVVNIEVLRSDFDAFGYDLVLTRRSLVRHVQLKTLLEGGKTREWKVAAALGDKPCGCVVVCVVTQDLELKDFLWFGGGPSEPLALDGLKVARHTKGNSDGEKLERPAHRVVPKGHFSGPIGMDDLIGRLFGPSTLADTEPSSHLNAQLVEENEHDW